MHCGWHSLFKFSNHSLSKSEPNDVHMEVGGGGGGGGGGVTKIV